jgi:hypothetical protein
MSADLMACGMWCGLKVWTRRQMDNVLFGPVFGCKMSFRERKGEPRIGSLAT